MINPNLHIRKLKQSPGARRPMAKTIIFKFPSHQDFKFRNKYTHLIEELDNVN